MAANDPSFDVATPRGVLQGVAVFTHDGANWQPAGRAATEVATPTGILRGVAAFSGGPNWAPATRAQTEVPTPSGVLDGVAVYTWSGAAWVPPSGNIEVATPSGVLEGIAAFDWDGASWQPQSQAGAEVPTPYGVLTGVARFGWTGSAWAAVGAPSLSLDFMTPGTLDPRIVFTRASTATYTDASGVIQTAAVNQPRWDYAGGSLRGLLIEEARSNYFANSNFAGGFWTSSASTMTPAQPGAPDGTASFTRWAETAGSNAFYNLSTFGPFTAGVTCALSVYARMQQTRYLQIGFDDSGANHLFATFDLQTGTVSGPLAVTGGTVGTASIQPIGGGTYRCAITGSLTTAANRSIMFLANTGNPVWFPVYTGNPANGLLVFGAQIEQGANATSYISTTATGLTRAADVAAIPPANMSPWFASPGGSWFAEFICSRPAPPNSAVIGQAGSVANGGITPIFFNAAFSGSQYDGANSVGSAGSSALNAIAKQATTWAVGQAKTALNGGSVGSSAALTTGYAALVASGISFLSVNTPGLITGMTGAIRRVSYWPRVLSDAEMQQVTT